MVARLVSSIRQLSRRTSCLNCFRTASKHCQVETCEQATQVDEPTKTTAATQTEAMGIEHGTQWRKQDANAASIQTDFLSCDSFFRKESTKLFASNTEIRAMTSLSLSYKIVDNNYYVMSEVQKLAAVRTENLTHTAQPKCIASVTSIESMEIAHDLAQNNLEEYSQDISSETETHYGYLPLGSGPKTSDVVMGTEVAIEQEILSAMEEEDATPDLILYMEVAMPRQGVSIEVEYLSNADKVVDGFVEPQICLKSEERNIPLPGTFVLKRSISSPGCHHIERDLPNKELFFAEARQLTCSLHKLDAGVYNFDPDVEFTFREKSFSRCSSSTSAIYSGIVISATKGGVVPPNSVQELSTGTPQPPVTLIEESIRVLEYSIGQCKGTLSDIEKELYDAMEEDIVKTQVSAAGTGSVEAKCQTPKEVAQNDKEGSEEETDRLGEANNDNSSDDIAFDMEEAMRDLEASENREISRACIATQNEESEILPTIGTNDQKDIPFSGILILTRSVSSPGFCQFTCDPPNTLLYWSEMRRGTRSLAKLNLGECKVDGEGKFPFVETSKASEIQQLKIWSLHERQTALPNTIYDPSNVLGGETNFEQAASDTCDCANEDTGKWSSAYQTGNKFEGDPEVDKGDARSTNNEKTTKDESDGTNQVFRKILDLDTNRDMLTEIEEAMQDNDPDTFQQIQHVLRNSDDVNEISVATENEHSNMILEIDDAMTDTTSDIPQSTPVTSSKAKWVAPTHITSSSKELEIPLPGMFTLTRSISAPASSHFNRDPPNAITFMKDARTSTKSLHRLRVSECNFDPEEGFSIRKWNSRGLKTSSERNELSSSPHTFVGSVTSSCTMQCHTNEPLCVSVNWMIISACSLESFCQIDKIKRTDIKPTDQCSYHSEQSPKGQPSFNNSHKSILKCQTHSISPLEAANNICLDMRASQLSYYVDDHGFNTPKVEVPVFIDEDIVWELEPDGTRRVLGTGSFGTVEAAWLRIDGGEAVPVAVKRYRYEKDQDAFIREGKMQTFLDSTGVFPKFYGYLDIGEGDQSIICLVSELFGKGTTLLDLIHDAAVLIQKEWMSVCIQLAKGLRKIHSKEVVFNDVKANNILVDISTSGTPLVKYIDPGLASLRSGIKYKYTADELRSLQHLAPEVKAQQSTSALSDIWGLGVLYAEIASTTGLPGLDHVARAAMATDPEERISLYGITETLVLIGRSQGLFST